MKKENKISVIRQDDFTVFLKDGDSWEPDAFDKIRRFYSAHPDAPDVCCCRIEYAGDYEGRKHPLDYMFSEGDKVVDLTKEPQYIVPQIYNVVFRTSAIRDLDIDIDPDIDNGAIFVNDLLLRDPRLGIIASATCFSMKEYDREAAVRSRAFYSKVPGSYYLELCRRSLDVHDRVLPFLQTTILYDLRWREYNRGTVEKLQDDERSTFTETMHTVLSYIDSGRIRKARGLNQYRKLVLFNLKYGRDVILEAKLKKNSLYLNKTLLLNLNEANILRIKVFRIADNQLTIEGITKLGTAGADIPLYLNTGSGEERLLDRSRYETADTADFLGKPVGVAECFREIIPIAPHTSIWFSTKINGKSIKLIPTYDNYIRLFPKEENNYCVKNGYIIKQREHRISFYRDSLKTRLASELRLQKELRKTDSDSRRAEHRNQLRLTRIVEDSKLKNQVAFVSVRSDGELRANMQKVYDMLDLPKVKFAKLNLYRNIEDVIRAAKLVYTSKIVVTDDYLGLFRDNPKRPGQKYIQLWHATGSGKKFGLDGTPFFPGVDRLYHMDYDLVTVSGEGAREHFASAFGLSAAKVQATGVARTDDFFDDAFAEDARHRIYNVYPQLQEKQVILYAPSFRDIPGVPRASFQPELDFTALSESLPENQIFVICPHPVMTEPILDSDNDNILEVRDFSTNEMMFASDTLITDYSSVMFEYLFLRKPMAFYCYDYDSYERDFYVDFDNDLPGPILRTQEELFSYLQEEKHPLVEDYEQFYEKYIGACDGHSTERIVKTIEEMFREQK